MSPTKPQAHPVSLAIQSELTLDQEKRTITGLVLPYGVLAQRTSIGAIRFAAGSLTHHPDLKRIKLLCDHDTTKAVGYCTDIEQTDHGVTATFHLPDGPDSDDALAKAANGIRDGLSIGADLRMHSKSADGRVTEVTEAVLNEVSLVSLPAFTDSRVHTVRASQHEGTTIMEPAPQPSNTETTEDNTTVEASTTPATTLEEAPYTPVAATATTTLDQMTSTIATVLKAGGTAQQVTAALADITPAADTGNAYIGRPTLLGELWQADNTDTPLLDALNKAPLTSTKVRGWKWDTKPQVAAYTGNKAEIPTGPVKTVPAETDAKRIAGGWDIDRVYLDLGDPAFLQSVFTAATADCKRKLEAAIATEAAAAATVVEAATSLTDTLTRMGTVAGQLGSKLNFIMVAPDVWAEFTKLTEAQVPWWLQQQGTVSLGTTSGTAGGLTFAVNHGLAAGQVLAGDRRAATVHQPSPNPIKVQALDIAHGGIDLGVYGYYALMIHDARALLLSTITTA